MPVKSNTGGRRNPLDDVGGGGPIGGGRTTGGGGGRTTRTGTPRTSTNTNPPARRTSPGQRKTTKSRGTNRVNAYKSEYGIEPKGRKETRVVKGEYVTGKVMSPKQARQSKSVKEYTKMKNAMHKDASKGYSKLNNSFGSKFKTPKQMKDARVAARRTGRGD